MDDNKTIFSAGEIIRSILSDNSEKLGLTNIFPVVTNKAILPYILYRRTAMQQVPVKSNHGASAVMVEISCCASTYDESIRIAESVYNTLDGASYNKDGLVMRSCFLSDSSEEWQDDAYIQILIFTIKI